MGSGSLLLQSSPTLALVLHKLLNSAQEFCPPGETLSWLIDQKYLALGGFLKITISVFEDISQCLPDW